MKPSLNVESKLADWVTLAPAVAPVLELHQLDYCCGGQRTLASACSDRGLDAKTVLAQLQAAHSTAANAGPSVTDWTQHSLTELCNHIEETHHAFLKQQLPRLGQLLDKVVRVHGEGHPELGSLAAAFRALQAELEPHMMKEERVLFPAIRLLESAPTKPEFPFGTVQNPIRMMEHEHDAAGHLLHEMRRLTNGYQPPAEACETWKQLLSGLALLERDLFQHIHKENNLLFPAAARLETDSH